MKILKNKNVKYIAKLAFSIALVVFCLTKVDFNNAFIVFRGAIYNLIFALFIICFIQKLLLGWGFANLFKFLQVNYQNKLEIIKVSFKSSIYFLAFPGFAAPDIYLTTYFTQKGNSLKKVVVTLIINRLTGFAIFVLISTFTLFFMFNRILDIYTLELTGMRDYLLILMIIVVILIAVLVVSKKYIYKKIRDLKANIALLKGKWVKNKQYFFKFLSIKIFWYFFSIFSRVFLAKAIGIEIVLIELISIIIIVNFLIAMPVSISGIGVREVSYVSLFSIFGVPAEKALLLSFLDFGIILIAVLIGSLTLLSERVAELIKLAK